MAQFNLLQLLELKVAVTRIEGELQKICKSTVGLSFAEVVVLLCILHRPVSCEADIAAVRGISRSAVSQSIQGLITKGLVVRNEAKDRRKKQPTLTEQGIDMTSKVLPKLESFAATLGTDLDMQDIQTFTIVVATMSGLNKGD